MVNCDSTREVELSLIRDICDLRGDTGAINEEQWKQPANRNRRIGSNDRFFPLSKRGWGARGILRLAQLSFLSSIKQVGSNARSRVELLPHPVRSVASRDRSPIARFVDHHPFRGSIVLLAIPFRKEGRRKRYAPLFLQHSTTSRANWADLYDADSVISTECWMLNVWKL